MNKFLNNYFKNIAIFLNNSEKDINKLIHIQKIFKSTAKKRKKIIFCGNGGSAATSSHVAVDLTKNAKIRAINFNEADLITCFSNDYGYESWVSSAVKFYADPGDVLVLISVSGKSKNLVNALETLLFTMRLTPHEKILIPIKKDITIMLQKKFSDCVLHKK